MKKSKSRRLLATMENPAARKPEVKLINDALHADERTKDSPETPQAIFDSLSSQYKITFTSKPSRNKTSEKQVSILDVIKFVIARKLPRGFCGASLPQRIYNELTDWGYVFTPK